jgi:hypothetical protein
LDSQALPFRQLSTALHACFGVLPAAIGTVCLHHPEYPGLLKAQSALGEPSFGGGAPTARVLETRSRAIKTSGQVVSRKIRFMHSSVLF